MLKKELQKLAVSLKQTEQPEAEPYILTFDEEQYALNHAIDQAQKFMAWKLRWLKDPDVIHQHISHTDWNVKIDRVKVLAHANMIKNQELWQKEQRRLEREKIVNKQKELIEYWTYGRVYNLMRYTSISSFRKELDVTADNLPVIKALCFYISRDDRFATELGFDRQKGLLIRGPSGTGKTHLVRCVENNGLNPILTLSMIDIMEAVEAEGKYKIDTEGKSILYLDDVGTEETAVKHYGTTKVWFKNYIENVYLHAKFKCFNNLIITTNLNYKAIGEKYGYRVESRMREMFNVVNLFGEDRRNKKNIDE